LSYEAQGWRVAPTLGCDSQWGVNPEELVNKSNGARSFSVLPIIFFFDF